MWTFSTSDWLFEDSFSDFTSNRPKQYICLMFVCAKRQQINHYNNNAIHFLDKVFHQGWSNRTNRLFSLSCKLLLKFKNGLFQMIFFSWIGRLFSLSCKLLSKFKTKLDFVCILVVWSGAYFPYFYRCTRYINKIPPWLFIFQKSEKYAPRYGKYLQFSESFFKIGIAMFKNILSATNSLHMPCWPWWCLVRNHEVFQPPPINPYFIIA